MVGEVEVKERPRPSPDYLMQLLNEKKLMTSLPNLCGIFTHLERLLDEGKRWLLRLVLEALGRSVTAARRGSVLAPLRRATLPVQQHHVHPNAAVRTIASYQFVLPVAYLT